MHDPDFMIQPMVFILDGGIMIYGDGSEIADMKDLDSITVAQPTRKDWYFVEVEIMVSKIVAFYGLHDDPFWHVTPDDERSAPYFYVPR